MTRVLCDPTFPLERARDVLLELDVVVETGRPPWAGDDVTALVAFEPVTVSDLERLPALRVISTPSVGFDHIDVEAATQRGVWVCSVPDYCVDEMADHALALLLALARGVAELDRSVRAGAWDHEAAGPLRRVSDLRLGIVGYGRIGRALAARARALGIDVCAYDPFVPSELIVDTGVRAIALDDLLRESTAISLHAPLTSETRGLIGPGELALLPEGAYLVNVARAQLVDLQAVLGSLASGRLAGAALDVLEVEPPSADAPAPQAPRLIVTPHAGWYSQRAEDLATVRALEAVRDVLVGRRPRTPVNVPDRR